MAGNNIAEAVLKKYLGLGKNGKPENVAGKRPGWTVLSGIVQSRDAKNYECVAIGTGIKSLAESQLGHAGQCLNDSHAEIICRRSFKLYIVQQVQKCIDGLESVIQKTGAYYEVKNEIRFSMYISQSPCGDASMCALESQQSQEVRNANLTNKRKYDELHSSEKRGMFSGEKVLRGRDDFNAIGMLRTKPGRVDAQPSLSMSCR